MRRLLLGLLALALLLPGAASAATNRGELGMYRAAAERYWHVKIPCLKFVDEAVPGHENAVATAEVGEWEQGVLTLGCTIYLNPPRWNPWRPRWRCDAILHEYGHLLGHRHTEDGTVMDVFHSRAPKVCRLFTP